MKTKNITANVSGTIIGIAVCYAIFSAPLNVDGHIVQQYWGGFNSVSGIALALSYAILTFAAVCAIFAVVAITIQTRKDEAFATLVLVPLFPFCLTMYQSAYHSGIALSVIAGALIGLAVSLIVFFHVRALDKRVAASQSYKPIN